MPSYLISTPSETLTATVAKTILTWIGGATRRFKCLRILLGGTSVTATDAAILVEVISTNQGGAGTCTAITPTLLDTGETASIGAAARTYTAEPTTVTVLDNFRISPIGNTYLWELPPGREYFRAVSTTFGLRLTSPATQTTNFAASMLIQE